MGFKFGSFDSICETAGLVVCPLVGSEQGVEPTCYSRNVVIAKTLLFQPATCFVHIVALLMTGIMIYHIRSKYTAVGRKEIVHFFYLYSIIELLAIFLDSGIIPTANSVYPWFAAIYTGLITATYTCILINGFVGFQWAEDGTPLSLWVLRIVCLLFFGVSFFVSIATFKNLAGFSYMNPIGLWIIYLLYPLICVAIYVIMQLILVIRTLDDRWPIGDIIFGTAFFAVGQVLFFVFSISICDAVQHYIDGLFFYTLCMLLSVMMVYKYWDSITKEDLEFSVGSKQAVWEIKDASLLSGNNDIVDDGRSGYSYGPGAGYGSGGYSNGSMYKSEDGRGAPRTPGSFAGSGNAPQYYAGQQQQQQQGRGYPPQERY